MNFAFSKKTGTSARLSAEVKRVQHQDGIRELPLNEAADVVGGLEIAALPAHLRVAFGQTRTCVTSEPLR